jgi:signal transduction histidine kinase
MLLNNKLKKRIRVEKHFTSLPYVECMPGKINQVFMNLLSNAIYAIEEKAVMEGRSKEEAGLGEIRIETGVEEEGIFVCISDDGIGIPQENLDRIFDPFFTTRDVGEGQGLGLSISYGIIEQHSGSITVDSEPGRGSTFCLYLPLRQQSVPAPDVEEEQAKA